MHSKNSTYSYTHAYCDRDIDRNAKGNSNANRNAESNRDTYSNRPVERDSNSNTESNRNRYGNTKGDTYSHAQSYPGLVANVSTRLPVGTGDNVLIEGFIVQGPSGSTKKIIVRAIGPSLLPFGITDALANPTLEIHDSNNATDRDRTTTGRRTQVGGIITGDQSPRSPRAGWRRATTWNRRSSPTLLPGSYTAVVRGLGNTTSAPA